MLLVISPAKALNFDPPPPAPPATRPVLAQDIARLKSVARKLSTRQIKRLMSLSDDLAALNHARFQAMDADLASDAAIPAVFAFNGDTYRGLRGRDLDPAALAWAQDHLRVLSGLYGVLRPLDAIEPYRLEMGVRLRTARGASLYDFWGDRIAKALDGAAEGAPIINLASQEYFAAAKRPALKSRVITCHFRERAPSGELKLISFFAKQARGLMARFAIEGRLDDPEMLKTFDREGYAFHPDPTRPNDWLFIRPART